MAPGRSPATSAAAPRAIQTRAIPWCRRIARRNLPTRIFPDRSRPKSPGSTTSARPSGSGRNTNKGVGLDSNFGFVDKGGTFTNVNNPNTGTTAPVFNQLLGVNDHDVAVGFYTDAAGVTHGYTYTIAANAFSANIDDPHAVGNTTAAAINNAGEVAGFYTDAGGLFHGVIDNGGSFTTLDAAGAMDTSLLGLNNLGEAVGFDIDANMMMHGIVCNVSALSCTQVDDPFGVGTTTFNGVNDLGQIVGFYVNSADNTIGLLANRVPEPPSLALFATGLLGIGIVWRRRQQGMKRRVIASEAKQSRQPRPGHRPGLLRRSASRNDKEANRDTGWWPRSVTPLPPHFAPPAASPTLPP